MKDGYRWLWTDTYCVDKQRYYSDRMWTPRTLQVYSVSFTPHLNRVFDHSVSTLEPWWNERLVKMPDVPSSLVLDVLARPFRRDPVDYACDEASERRETRLTRIINAWESSWCPAKRSPMENTSICPQMASYPVPPLMEEDNTIGEGTGNMLRKRAHDRTAFPRVLIERCATWKAGIVMKDARLVTDGVLYPHQYFIYDPSRVNLDEGKSGYRLEYEHNQVHPRIFERP
ncbi:hypothetical protein BKA83DRAFT_4127281 [Pisolithus microcarpus]|nr:hypothetical protein BKA83DRAFT_4127281 [Pisolithus microcarpus]